MKNVDLKNSLLAEGDQAFLALTQQIHHLLDLIDFYMTRWPVTDDRAGDSIAFKHEQLKLAINTLGSTPYQLAEVIRRWKHGEPRVLSKLGVELGLLNEIWMTMEVTMLFFIQADLSLDPYNRSKAEKAYKDLVQVNKLLD